MPRAEREQQILEVAHRLFAERGYGAVTMDEVAAEVGVTKPLLYAYAGNKERLYLAGMERAAEALMSTVMSAVQASSGPDEAFRDGVRAFFSFVDEDRDAWRVLFAESAPGGGEIARRIAQERDRLTTLVTQALVAQMPPQRRTRHRDEVEALSQALLGAVESMARWWLRAGTMSADATADLLVETILGGLRDRVRPSGQSNPGENHS